MQQGTDEYREHMRVYMMERYHKRRAEAVQLLGGKCVVCGTTEGLEIDHVDRSLKTMNVARMAWVSKERFLKELENCQLLCKPHHIDKTREEQSVPHGGGKAGKKNCPCDPCTVKRREYARGYKATRSGKPLSPKRKPPQERLKELHGTRKGYMIERRLGLDPCDECRTANSEYTRDLKARKALEQQASCTLP